MTERLLAWFDREATAEDKRYGRHVHVYQPGMTYEHEANSVVSLTQEVGRDEEGKEEPLHAPLIDDDNGYFRTRLSSTPGHQHVFIDKAIRWSLYVKLLNVLAECELVDPLWVAACISQGIATLRLPSSPKTAGERRPTLSDVDTLPF